MAQSVLVVSQILMVIPFGFVLSAALNDAEKLKFGYPRDAVLNFTEVAQRYGYLTEEHTIETEDGYILTLFRIVKGKRCTTENRFPPVLLVHGLLLSSDMWVTAGTKAGLGYLISDSCYEVWVANCRGTFYSRRHKTLNPDQDKEYWQFSVDEIGLYDIPAMVDYVLDKGGVDKLNYIGFSQGCGTYYIMCSEKAGYCNKINVMISLAPATRHLNAKSGIFRLVTQAFAAYSEIIYKFLERGEVLAKGFLSQEILGFFCQLPSTTNACSAILNILDGDHPRSIRNRTLRNIFGRFPAGTSVQNMDRYGQSMTSEDFVKFDYGANVNIQVYGSELPPKYNLSAVTSPVVVIYGKNDGIVDIEDVKWLINKLPNVIDSMEVQTPLWNHLDVSFSQHIGKYLFSTISKYLQEYSFTR